MIGAPHSYTKRFAKTIAALVVAFAILIAIATTSHADADYHWLDTFALTENSAGYNVTAFDIAPSGNLDGGRFFEQKVSSLWSVVLVSVLLQCHRQR